MRIALINIPIKAPWLGAGAWVTVPPQGYGGVQRVVATLAEGLLRLGHEVFLLGAPGSVSASADLRVIHLGEPEEMRDWIQENEVDIVHDSSNGVVALDNLSPSRPYLSTHHLTGRPKNPVNTVYLSHAQRRQAKATPVAPVIRIPINPLNYVFRREKHGYLLFLGRVSRWKGALEAAEFARAAGLPLLLAGPAWEEDYLREITERFGDSVQLVGEVGGERRLELLAGATALLVMSQDASGPWGDEWCEPGATVVSEAAVSGTPVVSTTNGCLAEITPKVGYALPRGETISPQRAREIIRGLPSPDEVRVAAMRGWGYTKIAARYERLYKEVIRGRQWR